MAFEPVDRTLNWEFAYWVNVVREWYAEGLPEIEGVPESLTGSQILHGPALFWPDGTSLGGLRFLFGEQNLSYMFYDDPQLIKDIQDHLTNLWITLFTEVLKDVTPDFCLLWEDISFHERDR